MRLIRRSPTCVLGTLLTFSLGFLLIQLNLIPLFGKNERDMIGGYKPSKRRNERNIQYEAISKFSSLLVKYHVSGFLIDPIILKSLLSFKGRSPVLNNYCLILCYNASFSQFGVISHSDVSVEFLTGVKNAGFKHFEVTGPDPRVLPMKMIKNHNIPYHHFFVYEGFLVQLVVFYIRSDSYFWHGKIDWSQIGEGTRFWSKKKSLYGSATAGAYQKMEFAEIKVDGVYFIVPKYPKKFLSQIPHSTFLECNYGSAAQFISRYYYDNEDVNGEKFRSSAKDILIAGATVLDELGIPFWLSSGTCLSWFRECRIIGHSLDVDFGMRVEDYSVRLIPAMEMAGLMLVHQFGKKSDTFELSFVKDQLKLDIFFFYEEGNTLWNGGTDTGTGEKYKYIFPWFDLCWAEFVEIKVRVPCQTLSYVEANYGKSWNTKVTSWNWKSSPPNVVPNGQWPKEEWPEVMQVFEIIEIEEG